MSNELRPTVRKIEEWVKKWEVNQIAFHQSNNHPFLVNNLDKLFNSNDEKIRILFPLCGKAVDMAWLSSIGHEVVGIEVSQLACEQFFTENDINFSIDKLDNFNLYKSEYGRIKIYNGDFFKFSTEFEKPFECVWDRGAYVALFYELRIKYVNQIKKLLNRRVRYLLEVFHYDIDLYPGPPFSCTREEIQNLFGEEFKVEFIESRLFNPFGDLLVEQKHPVEQLYLISMD